uniref:Uncharacterized protein n=1 Tax=Anguilla anguilla TaxID=7936 RepID=A0A0E9SHR7_ANGAN
MGTGSDKVGQELSIVGFAGVPHSSTLRPAHCVLYVRRDPCVLIHKIQTAKGKLPLLYIRVTLIVLLDLRLAVAIIDNTRSWMNARTFNDGQKGGWVIGNDWRGEDMYVGFPQT